MSGAKAPTPGANRYGSLDAYRRAVDEECWRLAGLSINDLPDVPLVEWYDDDVSASSAARKAIRRAG